jgi:hypothetical protein
MRDAAQLLAIAAQLLGLLISFFTPMIGALLGKLLRRRPKDTKEGQQQGRTGASLLSADV